jgi:hypothetical protein
MKVGDLVKHTELGWLGIVTDKTLVHNGQVLYRIYFNGISSDFTSTKWEVLKKV